MKNATANAGRRSALALVLLVTFSGLGTGPALATTGPFRIFLIAWRGCEDACRGFKDYVRERGFASEVVVRDAAGDRSTLPEFVREARERRADLVVTWGTSVTRGVVGAIDAVDPAKHITDIPVVFMIVADPLGARIVTDYDSSGRANVTGTRNRVPESVQMKAIRAYRPFQRLGLVFNEGELNSVLNAEKIADLAAEMGFELVTHALPPRENGQPSADDIPAALHAMKRAQVEFVYVGSSSFLMANRDRFTREALAMGLPVAAAYEDMAAKSQALVAVASRYYNVGRLAGYQAEQVLVEGLAPIDVPIRSLRRFSYVVNMETARQLGVYPPLAVLRYAEVVHGKPEGQH